VEIREAPRKENGGEHEKGVLGTDYHPVDGEYRRMKSRESCDFWGKIK